MPPPPSYHRYHIETRPAPDIVPWPSRFKVQVSRAGLAKLLLTEMLRYKGDLEIVLSRPCLYGVFSGPVGGFAPREQFCVGCLRCTTQHPDFVQIRHNPARRALGDSYFTPDQVTTVASEAQGGAIPVKGAGYRGPFGGSGWDGMWTDMSEIVRPTRDGIHGREFISTVVDIGAKPGFLSFAENGEPRGATPNVFGVPVPFLFDAPPAAAATPLYQTIVAQAAEEVGTLAFVPAPTILERNLRGPHLVPLLTLAGRDALPSLPFRPRLVALDGWDPGLYAAVQAAQPQAQICLRTPFPAPEDLLAWYAAGVRIFHLTADYHGHGGQGAFIFGLIRAAHGAFVDARCREEVTLLGSGGLVAAEHVPKAILAGLDAVVLDTPLLVAVQARFEGEFTSRYTGRVRLPRNLSLSWGVQRIKNLSAAWRDQLLEILGAMGLREVRRLRGEIGRAMFQKHLEHEAFAGIEGYPNGALAV